MIRLTAFLIWLLLCSPAVAQVSPFPGSPQVPPSTPTGGTPGGTSGQIQYNNAGAFGGLTDTQVTTHIDTFTTSAKGAVPSPGSTTGKVLSDNGTWITVSTGGGSVPGGSNLQVQYNNAGAFSGLTDAALTARIINFTGALSGSVPASGGGTSNFLRADGQWVSPAGSGSGSAINTAITPQWWASSGAINSRIGDRLFIGDAVNYYNVSSFTSCGTDWFSQFESTMSPNGCGGYIGFANLVAEAGGSTQSGGSALAIVGAAQSKFAGNDGAAYIGLAGFGVANNSSHHTAAWGLYGECHFMNGSSGSDGCYGLELDVRNMVGGATITNSFTQSTIVGAQIACGAGVDQAGQPCGAAIQILTNTQPFAAGIVIQNGSVTLGSAAIWNAITMPPAYSIVWNLSSQNVGARIYMGNSGNLNFATQGTLTIDGNSGVSCVVGINSTTFRSLKGLVTAC